jgi:cyclic beta-1,2-glucan synthetase
MQYRVEPYVVAADIYSTRPHAGRGGWTWYTGSSGWLYRLGIEAILGFQRQGDHMKVEPCIPAAWDGYRLTYKNNGTIYNFEVKNPDHVQTGVRQVLFDGEIIQEKRIPLIQDQSEHRVEIIMG